MMQPSRRFLALLYVPLMACQTLLAPAMAANSSLAPITGVDNAEDMVPLPEARWVITGGLAIPRTPYSGHLYLIDRDTLRAIAIYPAAGVDTTRPSEGDAGCPPPDHASFSAHGVDLRVDGTHHHTLYVVNDQREAIEIFSVDVSQETPQLRWQGCVALPQNAAGNDVAALPEGGFAVSVWYHLDDPQARAKLERGEVTGEVLEWHPGAGFYKVPGSELSGDNGIRPDPSGKYYFITAWGSHQLYRLSRGKTPFQRLAVEFPGILPDDLNWDARGFLLLTGSAVSAKEAFACVDSSRPTCPAPYRVAQVDPRSLQYRIVLDEKNNPPNVGIGSGAIQVGDRLWVDTFRGQAIAQFPYTP